MNAAFHAEAERLIAEIRQAQQPKPVEKKQTLRQKWGLKA